MDQTLHTDLILTREGDHKAFERIYRKYWGRVWHFTSLYIGDEFEREEIVQKVFIRLWNSRSKLNVEVDPDGLLFITTRNLIFNHHHRSLNEKALKDAIEKDSVKAEEILSAIEANDLDQRIDSLVEALPPRQKEAFELNCREGLSYKEIAQKMGISEKGVERNIYLARKFLKENLALFILFLGFI